MANEQPIRTKPAEQQRLDERHGQTLAQPLNRSSEMSSNKRQEKSGNI